MYQTVEQSTVVEKSEESRSKEQVNEIEGRGVGKLETTKDGNSSDSARPSLDGRPLVQRLVVVSLAVSLEKMRGLSGNSATHEIIELLHNENFNLELFRTMVKSCSDCKRITADVIEQCKAR